MNQQKIVKQDSFDLEECDIDESSMNDDHINTKENKIFRPFNTKNQQYSQNQQSQNQVQKQINLNQQHQLYYIQSGAQNKFSKQQTPKGGNRIFELNQNRILNQSSSKKVVNRVKAQQQKVMSEIRDEHTNQIHIYQQNNQQIDNGKVNSKKSSDCISRLFQDAERRKEYQRQQQLQKQRHEKLKESENITFQPNIKKDRRKKNRISKRSIDQFVKDQNNYKEMHEEKIKQQIIEEESKWQCNIQINRKSQKIVQKIKSNEIFKQNAFQRLSKISGNYIKKPNMESKQLSQKKLRTKEEQQEIIEKLFKPVSRKKNRNSEVQQNVQNNLKQKQLEMALQQKQNKLIYEKMKKMIQQFLVNKNIFNEDVELEQNQVSFDQFKELFGHFNLINIDKISDYDNKKLQQLWQNELGLQEEQLVYIHKVIIILCGILKLDIDNINQQKMKMYQDTSQNGEQIIYDKWQMHKKYYNFYNNKKAYKKNQNQNQQQFTFKPEINKKSQKIQQEKQQQQSLMLSQYDRLMHSRNQHQQKMKQLRQQQVMESLKECTFNPIKYKNRMSSLRQSQSSIRETKLFNDVMKKTNEENMKFKIDMIQSQKQGQSLNQSQQRYQELDNLTSNMTFDNLLFSNTDLDQSQNFTIINQSQMSNSISPRKFSPYNFNRINQRISLFEKEYQSNNQKKPLIYVDINLGEKGNERIAIFYGDDPKIIAQKFVLEHQLPEKKAEKLEQLLIQKILNQLNKSTSDYNSFSINKEKSTSNLQQFPATDKKRKIQQQCLEGDKLNFYTLETSPEKKKQ